MQEALKVAVAVALAALLSLTLGGCELLDPNDEAFAPLDSGPVSKPAAQPAPEAAAPNVSGDLKLTFAGTPPAPGAFSIPNTTMVLAKDGTLKASKTVTFVPAQTNGTGKDVWVFDCTESQSGTIAGTASYKRTMQWSNKVFDKTEVHKSFVTWSGTVAGKRGSDGAVAGTVTGVQSSSADAGTQTKPFSWTFSGR
jgi:hypothetical protein